MSRKHSVLVPCEGILCDYIYIIIFVVVMLESCGRILEILFVVNRKIEEKRRKGYFRSFTSSIVNENQEKNLEGLSSFVTTNKLPFNIYFLHPVARYISSVLNNYSITSLSSFISSSASFSSSPLSSYHSSSLFLNS
jgi:hypothetical protein